MKYSRRMLILFLGCMLSGTIRLGADEKARDQELLNQGKILMFDKNWDGARAVLQRVIQEHPKSNTVPQAYYYIARCYQFQGRELEALQSYEVFLQKYPNEPIWPMEVRKSVVQLAASLMEKGNRSYKDRLLSALASPQKEVRYFAAIRCSRVDDRSVTSAAIPVLREISKNETEPELADRAKIALLRLEPSALVPPDPPKATEKKPDRGSGVRMFHLVVHKSGASQPSIELNLPLSLAQLAIGALDESAKAELRKKGVDVDNIWQDLKRLGPTNILTFRSGQDLIKIWIE
jgi:tetratricopeptide (TPR) repeat protein